ncbi:hypothetical protein [Roseomonas sp. BN140053]|uniref:hypothetical protein n=1 Tax=Roseomonas sp. BN140053 TaxID=3391898 RepID=UPI0039E90CB7
MDSVELSEIVSLALIAGVVVGGAWTWLTSHRVASAGAQARWTVTPAATVAGALAAIMALELLLLLHR